MNLTMTSRRIISGVCLFLTALYFIDMFTSVSFGNISELLPWQIIGVPIILVAITAPSPSMIREYNKRREDKR